MKLTLVFALLLTLPVYAQDGDVATEEAKDEVATEVVKPQIATQKAGVCAECQPDDLECVCGDTKPAPKKAAKEEKPAE
jgi:hypothetical protein